MSTLILATKLYAPPPRPNAVARPRLIARLNEGLQRKLTLVSAAAGFGKTTLVSAWAAACGRPVAWLSLDAGDSDSARFLAYLVAALQTLEPKVGAGVLAALQSPQPPSGAALLAALVNEIAAGQDEFALVLDDYHAVDARAVDDALAFLVEHLPPRMHLVIATREDPQLPLARLRARGQLTELRAADLRFTADEAAEFLNAAMGLNLSANAVAALEARTEGWIAGLQLAALALQVNPALQAPADTAGRIRAFSGSHRFVLDYLLEEVLQQQPADIQAFLLGTAILDRLCGPLCEAVLRTPAGSGQATLEYLERANLFLVPLDNERRWYRYHQLFADLLRQRAPLNPPTSGGRKEGLAELHVRASVWFETNGLEVEAFHHAAAAHDVERAERLIESGGMPMHFRGAVTAILDWLAALPKAVLDARPSLWVKSATLALVAGQTTGVEEKLQAAEAALQGAGLVSSAGEVTDDRTRNLIGQIAAARATLALTRYQAEEIIVQARRAQEYLAPNNLPFRLTAAWTLAIAHHIQGDRAAAGRAYAEALAIARASGDAFSTILATDGLGQIQEMGNQLYSAAETYRQVLALHGDHPQPNACETHLGLARVYYQWNDLDAAERHGQQSLQLARQYDRVIDRFVLSEVFLARLQLARGDAAGAAAALAQAEQSARAHNFAQRIPEIAAAQVEVLLRLGDATAAANVAQAHALPVSQARVLLAQGDAAAAMALLEPLRREMETRGWEDERLKVTLLQAVAHHVRGDRGEAVQLLGDALALAEPGGFVRLFVDEGPPLQRLLQEVVSRGNAPEYPRRLLAAFPSAEPAGHSMAQPRSPTPQSGLVEPLSERELEVLRHIAAGLTNPEIAQKLHLSLHTVKVHSRNIYGKLGAHNRTQAVGRARALGLLTD